MLYDFLNDHREAILDRCKEKIAASVVPHPTTEELSEGAPVFLAQIEDILRKDDGSPGKKPVQNDRPEKTEVGSSAAHHGRQLLELGFTLSQVVHGYGAVCQVVTGMLDEEGAKISAREYQTLNLCLDDAIAEAVTSYEAQTDANADRREVEHLGALAHELRNALGTAMTVAELLNTGQIGTDGRTASLLGKAHARMRDLIDRSLAEVRLRAELEPRRESVRLSELFDDVATTARIDARPRGIELHLTVDPALWLKADRQLLVSAVANLVQNAIKFSRPRSQVYLRALAVDDGVRIEVEDSCGGISKEKVAQLFAPYVQSHEDRSGLGLGLPIVQRAVRAQGGQVHVRNVEGKGCLFTIELPRSLGASPSVTTH